MSLFFRIAAAVMLTITALTLAALDQLTVTPDRELPVYRCGEQAKFSFAGFEGGKPVGTGKYQVRFLFCGRTAVKTAVIDFAAANPATLECTLDRPGFILAEVCGHDGTGLRLNRRQVLGGAAFEPEKIRAAVPVPEDFQEFWTRSCREAAAKPVTLTRDERRSTEKYTLYRVSVPALNGGTLTGCLTIPVGTGKFPVYVTVPGAGAGVCGPAPFASDGVITLVMNVHKFPTADTQAEQVRRYEADRQNGFYALRGIEDRDKYFFRGVFAGISRVIDEVAALPQWDGRHLVFDGSSQGGGTALIVTALNSHVTAAAANVPAFCDQSGGREGRAPGWPNLAGRDPAGKVSPYFDTASFTPLIRVPVLVSCGFLDTTCPPASIYAAANRLTAPKELVQVPDEGHTVSRRYLTVKTEFIRRQLGK